MLYPIHSYIRRIAMETPDGDVTKKFRAQPKVKPARRKPSVQNESSREDYMKEYMKDYRGEGKDYQKLSPKIKELRKKQKQEKKEKEMKVTSAGRVGIGIPIPVSELCITNNDNNVLIIS